MGDKIRGYLIVTVAEASGRNKNDDVVWDPNFTEGFCKVELRGGPRNVKVQSKIQKVVENMIQWQEEVQAELLEGAQELRIMLCREKRTGTRVGTSVVAACGIYVNDILDAVPIDKYFELFKPGVGGDGGFIRVSMNFVTDLNELTEPQDNGGDVFPFVPQLSFKGYSRDESAEPGSLHSAAANAVAATDAAANGTEQAHAVGEGGGKKKKKKRGPPIIPMLLLGAAAFAVVKLKNK